MEQLGDAAISPQRPAKLLTVGIPVFNGKSLLRNCLHSVINSTLSRERFEIVIGDDGSFDPETLAILREFEELTAEPEFLRVVSLGANSGGAARPRNQILAEATGEYVFFVDSDDTIGSLSLERIAEAVATHPADWVALNQVPVNGRVGVCVVHRPQALVPRTTALTTLTVHKVFRRAEVERQHLRFDEGLPSGQDVVFAFSFITHARGAFLMLGGYDYYYLNRHDGNPNEPAHLSKRAKTPAAVVEKNERILRLMLTALETSDVPEAERRTILAKIVLPRFLLQEGYLKAIVDAGPDAGGLALHRLSELLTHPLSADLDPNGHKGLTAEHLAVISSSDLPRLARLVTVADAAAPTSHGLASRVVAQGRRVVDVTTGRARHRRVLGELALLRRSVEDIRQTQRRLEERLHVQDAASAPPTSHWGSPQQARSDGTCQVTDRRAGWASLDPSGDPRVRPFLGVVLLVEAA